MISPSRRSRSARRFSAAVAAAIAAAASVALPSPTLRTERRSSSSSASRFARSAASARARAASAAPAFASARRRASSAIAFASVSSTSSCASRFSKFVAELAARSSAAFFASSSASSADAVVAAAAAFSAPSAVSRVSASANFFSAAAARFSNASASLARAAALANARTAAFSSPSPSGPVETNDWSSEASTRLVAFDALAESARISSRGVPLRIRSSTSYVRSAFLVFLSSARAALARARCSCASARASMPSRCACSATPRSRSLCAASVSCTCSRYSTWHCARRITLRALDVVRYRESSTETSPNVTVSCGRRRAGRVVGLRRDSPGSCVGRRASGARPRRGLRRRRDDGEKVVVGDERAHRVGTRGTSRGRTRTLSSVSMSFSRITRSTSTAWMARQSMRARRASNANAGGASEGASGPAASPPGATATGSAIPRFPPDPPVTTDGRRVLPRGESTRAATTTHGRRGARHGMSAHDTRGPARRPVRDARRRASVSEAVSRTVQRSDSISTECARRFERDSTRKECIAIVALYALPHAPPRLARHALTTREGHDVSIARIKKRLTPPRSSRRARCA